MILVFVFLNLVIVLLKIFFVVVDLVGLFGYVK